MSIKIDIFAHLTKDQNQIISAPMNDWQAIPAIVHDSAMKRY